MGKWLAEFQENTLETPIPSTDITDISCDTSVLSVSTQGVSVEKTEISDDAELIKQAFREGKAVRVWSGVLQEWIWWSPSKETAKRKKQETDEIVYHKGELIKLVGWDSQSLKDMHEIKKAFDGEIIK